MSCGDANKPICPCSGTAFPAAISNLPGLASIAYRIGDYSSFREALLTPLQGETALSQSNGTTITPIWRPGADGDLAVQLVEWWAYLADVLTFYNERIANESYLGTAFLPESVNHLIQLLGYRPRPGLGSTCVLGALANSVAPFTLPQGFQIQSKPGPGQAPQIFELDSNVTITPPVGPPGTNAIQGTAPLTAATPASQLTPTPSPDGLTSLIAISGTSSAVKVGDSVLLLHTPFPPSSVSEYVLSTVQSVTPGKDPQGNPYTSYGFNKSDLENITDVTKYHLFTSSQSVQVWQYPAAVNLVMRQSSVTPPMFTVDLASIVRSMKSGDVLVYEGPATFTPWCVNLSSSTEVVWYANPANFTPPPSDNTPADPATPPDFTKEVPIAIPHTEVTFGIPAGAQLPTDAVSTRPSYLIRYGWKDVGALIVVPAPTVGTAPAAGGSSSTTTPPLTLTPPAGSPLSATTNSSVLVEDVNGNGGMGSVNSDGSVQLNSQVLVPPLRAILNLLNVSRGQTVSNEILGSGNALVPSQDFTLQKSPVTYFLDSKSISGDDYSSTVRVWVNQVEWMEVRSFYNLPDGAQVFITREDDQGQTHVVFGSRLPTGTNNVVASYRYGSGAAEPAVGSLTVILQPMPGLQAVRNPVAPAGGEDPDPPSLIRELAPRSTLTFGRAVSVDDFLAIVSQTSGVNKAKVGYAFDPKTYRSRVTVWVGDDSGAVSAAQAALAVAADPNNLPNILLAKAVKMKLSLTIQYDSALVPQPPDLASLVHDALLDPDSGLLGINVVGIGEIFYDSQIYAACLAVPGVVAVQSLIFSRAATSSGAAPTSTTSQQHDPGQDSYLLVPDDSDHFTLSMEAAT
jgi:hypothetical protein